MSRLSLLEVVDHRAATQPDRDVYRFLADGESERGKLTYGDLAGRARALAGRLSRMARPGERALLVFPAGLDFPVAFLACLYAGIVAVPVEVPRRRSAGDRLAAIAGNCGATLFLSHHGVQDRLPDLGLPWVFTDALESAATEEWEPCPITPGTMAYLQYTSGSTQAPRGAAISHRALLQQLDLYLARYGSDPENLIVVGWLPHTHDFGLVGFVLHALYAGVPYIFMPPTAFLRRPLRWIEAIDAFRGSYTGAPNFGYDLCARAGASDLSRNIDLSCLRIASLGGDHIVPETLARFAREFAPSGFRSEAFLPAYGLAEAVLCATGRQGAVVKAWDRPTLSRNKAIPATGPSAIRLVSCGTPSPTQHLLIVDPTTLAPLAEGEVGEIWLAGASLADGYWNDPAATKAQFAATPRGHSDIRYLRTGDCGFLNEGELYVTGRLKDVLVVRGANHAPEDIEQTIQSVHPALRPGCGAVVQAQADGGPELVAIQEVVREDRTDNESLFAAIALAVSRDHGLTLDAIHLIRIGTLPRTSNGKISRVACRQAYQTGTLRCVATWRRLPDLETLSDLREVEACLRAALRDELRVTTVPANQNLFELGLDSLGIQILLARLDSTFGVELSIETVFEEPTLAGLAAQVSARRPAAREPRTTTVPEPDTGNEPDTGKMTLALVFEELRRLNDKVAELTRLVAASLPPPAAAPQSADMGVDDAPFALTETQQEITLFGKVRNGAQAVFNVLMIVECPGEIDVDSVRSALRRLAERHESLRTVFAETTQCVLPTAEPVLDLVTLKDEATFGDWVRAERLRPFAFDQVPPWRATLLRGRETSLLVVTAHHLVLDGFSTRILGREFAALYADATAVLPLPMQFRQFCATADAPRDAAADEQFWRAMLGTRVADFVPPGDSHLLRAVPYDAAVHTVMIGADDRLALHRSAATARATLFHIMLAAYFALLHRVSGQERIVVGIDAANRTGGQEESVVGCCNLLVPLSLDFSAIDSAAPLPVQMRDLVVRALAHRNYTMSMWARDAGVAPDLERPFKIFAVMNMQRFPSRMGAFTPRFDLENQALSQSPFGLLLDIRDTEDGLRCDFVYNTHLFKDAQIARYAEYYGRLLDALAQDAAADLLAAPILSEAETDRLFVFGRSTQAPEPYIPLFRHFNEQVALAPDAQAVACATECLSYRELQVRARTIGHAISTMVPPGAVVALLCERGSTFLASMLGIMGRGCIYLPLSPEDPDARLAEQLAQVEAGLLLHDDIHEDLAAALCGAGLPKLSVANPSLLESMTPAASPLEEAHAEAPAYVIFTSGSTGVPKAAEVSHGGMVNHLAAKISALALGTSDILAQTASPGFDVSVWQFLAPLLVGGQVRVLGDRITHDPAALFAETQRHGVTVLEVVPSILRPALDILIEPGKRHPLKAMRWLMSTGEVLPPGLCRRWISLYPDIPVMNAYGPAECSDDVTHQVIEWPPAQEAARVPIGRPIPGAELYVLDRRGEPAPTGAMGEIWVGGPCVGRGYRNDPARTRAAFLPDRFTDRPDALLYRTGDLARFLDDGTLDHLGRVDHQVKINGVRIEPGEIEAAIQRDPTVRQSLVRAVSDAEGRERLVAYVVFRTGTSSSEGELKAAARKVLPPALVPTAFVFVEAIPLLANGKIDTARLPPPEFGTLRSDVTPPSNAVEESLIGIWSATLRTSARFGIHDDFFDLGGSSLVAALVSARIEELFNVRVAATTIFRNPTIAELASIIHRLMPPSGAKSAKTLP